MGPINLKSGSVERRDRGSSEGGADQNMLHGVGMPATKNAFRALPILGPKTVRGAPGVCEGLNCAGSEMGRSMNEREFNIRKLL